jgi:hypothetical protein
MAVVWSLDPPTKPGWFWVRDARRYGIAHVRQGVSPEGLKFLWVEALYPTYGLQSDNLDAWPSTHEWAGPLDTPFQVPRLCIWNLGCSIPMLKEIDEPASLCLWHQACIKSATPIAMALDRAQFDDWIQALVAPVPAPWGRSADVLWPVTFGKRDIMLAV